MSTDINRLKYNKNKFKRAVWKFKQLKPIIWQDQNRDEKVWSQISCTLCTYDTSLQHITQPRDKGLQTKDKAKDAAFLHLTNLKTTIPSRNRASSDLSF